MLKMKTCIKKMFSIQMIILIVLTMIINMNVNEVKAYTVTHKQTTAVGINAFPDSYKQKLEELKRNHPNWNFTAFNTDISWSEFMNNETGTHFRNSVHKSSDSSWKDSCNIEKSGYVCASRPIVAYYADPRNFLTESGMFQFLDMTYNSSTQTKSGVQSIVSNTFMKGSVTIRGEIEDTSVKAKQEEYYIYVTPGTKNSEVATAVGKPNFKVVNKDNKTMSASDNAGTGYTFTNTANNTSYTMIVLGDVNGDGEVTSTDFAMVRAAMLGQTFLNNVQKKAADINGDGEVKATDFARVRSHMLGETFITIKGNMTIQNTTMSYADIIMKAAEESGISPYSIAIKIIQEVGTNGSNSVSGTCPGYEGYYNFYNWGASDGGNAVEKGLIYAKEKGWNNQYIAIVEGAKKMADSYVGVGQNTAYFYKFDVVDDTATGLYWHQFMTNVQDPSSQASNLYNTYAKNNAIDISLNFIIPVFKDMPESNFMPNGISSSDRNSYFINGTGVQFRDMPGTWAYSYGTLAYGEIVTVEELNHKEANGYTWAKIKTSNGTVGYVANCYLTKC